jgi:predicted nucleic acid-binding protein
MTSASSSSIAGFSQQELNAHRDRARAQLAATLDAVEEKVNIPKRLDRAAARARARLRTMRQENPVGLAAIGAGAAALVGVVVYVGYRSLNRR